MVRTRTVIRAAHIRINFSARLEGQATGIDLWELRRAVGVITSYATQLGLSPASILVRKDLVVRRRRAPARCPLSGLGVITRSRAYHLLELPVVKQTLARTPDHVSTHEDESHDTLALRLHVRALDPNRS